MREMVNKDNQNMPSNSFLLDDDLRYTAFSHPSSFNLLAVVPINVHSSPCLRITICINSHCSIPFSAEDVDMAIPPIDLDEIDLPLFVSEYSCAQFLNSHQQ